MTYTTQQLQAMTNFEIGKALAIKCGKIIADDGGLIDEHMES